MSKEKKEIIVEDDRNGLKTYEYLVNNLNVLTDDKLDRVVKQLEDIDLKGQYLASGARYLNAVDRTFYKKWIDRMVSSTIDRDRQHDYIGALITAIYGQDYKERLETLIKEDNFRRMYKRLFPQGAL